MLLAPQAGLHQPSSFQGGPGHSGHPSGMQPSWGWGTGIIRSTGVDDLLFGLAVLFHGIYLKEVKQAYSKAQVQSQRHLVHISEVLKAI